MCAKCHPNSSQNLSITFNSSRKFVTVFIVLPSKYHCAALHLSTLLFTMSLGELDASVNNKNKHANKYVKDVFGSFCVLEHNSCIMRFK